MRRWVTCVLILCNILFVVPSGAAENCPGADDPPPPVRKADIPKLASLLRGLTGNRGLEESLHKIFEAVPRKTKLEEFFQLLFLLQREIGEKNLPLTVQPPGITEILLAAQVFTDTSFPRKITSVELLPLVKGRPPLYRVLFSEKEVRFPINEGKGFSVWEQGMCQVAKALVFYPGFSFRIRKARNSQNLVVEDFDGVEIYGQFGTRKIFSIDLNYVDLEKVEFIAGTDEGRVKSRVARREFRENPHSRLFRFIGTLIPNTSRQRIDW